MGMGVCPSDILCYAGAAKLFGLDVVLVPKNLEAASFRNIEGPRDRQHQLLELTRSQIRAP